MKLLFVSKNPAYTITTGMDNVLHGIETTFNRLATNKKALQILNLVSDYADKRNAIDWFVFYMSEFKTYESKTYKELYESNPDIQILCNGDLLNELKKVL